MKHPEFKKVSPKQEWLRLGIKLVVLVLIFWIILGVLFGIRRIEGVAMDPKVSDGDLSLFFRTNDNLEAGDVVLFSKDDKQYVSRIIGVENDVISLDEEGHLYLNGEDSRIFRPIIFRAAMRSPCLTRIASKKTRSLSLMTTSIQKVIHVSMEQ